MHGAEDELQQINYADSNLNFSRLLMARTLGLILMNKS